MHILRKQNYISFRIHVYLNKHGKAYILILYTRGRREMRTVDEWKNN